MTESKITITLPTIRSTAKISIYENQTLYNTPICGHAKFKTYSNGEFKSATYPRVIWVKDELSRYQIPICFECLLNELDYIKRIGG